MLPFPLQILCSIPILAPLWPAMAPQVTCMHGLHLLDTRRALEECYRVLKPSGVLIAGFNDT